MVHTRTCIDYQSSVLGGFLHCFPPYYCFVLCVCTCVCVCAICVPVHLYVSVCMGTHGLQHTRGTTLELVEASPTPHPHSFQGSNSGHHVYKSSAFYLLTHLAGPLSNLFLEPGPLTEPRAGLFA